MAKVKIKSKVKAVAEKFNSKSKSKQTSKANKSKNLKITLSGKNSKKKTTTITIPVNPEKITYKASGKFQEYQIINQGTAKVPSGKELSYVGWECFFPGESIKNMPFIKKYEKPDTLRKQIEYWRKAGKKVKVSISTTPINMYCYIESYEESYEGSNDNIYYMIELSSAVDVKVETVKKKKGKTSGANRGSKNDGAKTYTVKEGDCLWNISKKFYKKYTQWKKIYNANKSTIEKAAKKHGKKNSNNGHWIYPGTKLKIP